MARGTVKFFNTEKGFGFIAREQGADVFFHYSQIITTSNKSLAEGEVVEFDVVPGARGDTAENVKPL
jgi:CspA family cold shock protein